MVWRSSAGRCAGMVARLVKNDPGMTRERLARIREAGGEDACRNTAQATGQGLGIRLAGASPSPEASPADLVKSAGLFRPSYTTRNRDGPFLFWPADPIFRESQRRVPPGRTG
jgi:hypothetical protein